MNFIEKVLAGDEFEDRICDYVADWHKSTTQQLLHDFLGLTRDEYALWVEQPDSLRSILLSHKMGTPINHLDWDDVHLLAARSQSQHNPEILLHWLKSKGLL